MGAKVDNTPRFVLPRLVDTVTVSKTISMSDTTPQTIYTATKDCFVTLEFTRGVGSGVTTAKYYLNDTQIGETVDRSSGFIPADDIANFPDRFINSVYTSTASTGNYSYALFFPMILKAGDVISIARGQGSGSYSRTFNLTINFWE